MYHVDSKRRVDAYDFDARSGCSATTAASWLRPNDAKGDSVDSVPDGLCVDVEGGVWVCVWGAGETFGSSRREGRRGGGSRPRSCERRARGRRAVASEGGRRAARTLSDVVLAGRYGGRGGDEVSVENRTRAVFAVDVGVEGVEARGRLNAADTPGVVSKSL